MSPLNDFSSKLIVTFCAASDTLWYIILLKCNSTALQNCERGVIYDLNHTSEKRHVIVAKRSGAKIHASLSSLGNTPGWQLCPALLFQTPISSGNTLHIH